MKKTLLICFLGLLCLPGSTIRAQRLVVESPRESTGAGLLHRFDGSHRGGETRSDTSLNITAQEIDGGPFLHRQKGFSLVDDSISQGQASFDSLERGSIYFELGTSEVVDSLTVRFWEQLVSDSRSVNPGVSLTIPASEGNMFEGSRNYQVFSVPLPQSVSSGFFSLGRGKGVLSKHWIYFPSDRVRIRVDLRTGRLLFGGPEADFYRLQYEVDRAFEEESFNSDPVLISQNREFFRKDSTTQHLWEISRNRPEDLYVKMKVLGDSQEAFAEFERFAASTWQSHSAMKVLSHYAGLVPKDRLDRVEAGIKGRILFMGMKKAEQAWPLIQKDRLRLALVRQWVAGFHLDDSAYSHPMLAQGAYTWASIVSISTSVPMKKLMGDLPNPLREEIIAFYVLYNFNRLEGRLPGIVSDMLPLLESEWIKERFEGLLAVQRSEFSPGDIFLEDGSTLGLERLKGKTLLIHFWISGCKFCLLDHQTVMKDLSAKYRDRPDILVVTVNADAQESTWKKSLSTGEYTSPDELNTWVSQGTGLLKTYGIHSFPQKMIIGTDGMVKLQTINRMEMADLSALLEEISSTGTTSFSLSQTSKP